MSTNQNEGQRRPPYFYSILSVTAVLFLLGFFGILLLQTKQLTKNLKEQVDIIIELVPDNNEGDRQIFATRLSASPYIIKGSIEYTPKENALEIMSNELGEELLNLDLPNPLHDVYTFNVKAVYLAPDSLVAIQEVLTRNNIVNDVYYQESLIDQLSRNIQRISWILFDISLFFVIIALTVIHNTIRLALHSNRFIIKTQELVGASWEFISRPYLGKALWHGFLSSCFAIGLLILIQFWMQEQLPEIKSLQDPLAFSSLFFALIILGMLINWVSTFFAVRKYLKLGEDELH